jgi:hypothetical protein
LALQKQLGEAMTGLNTLEELHKKVEQKTSILHAETSALESEKQNLSRLAAALHEQLQHFKTLDVAAATLNHSTVSVRDPAFSAVLARLDEALKFVRSHPSYLGSEHHLQRFAQLQQRGLQLLKEHVVAQLKVCLFCFPSSFSFFFCKDGWRELGGQDAGTRTCRLARLH